MRTTMTITLVTRGAARAATAAARDGHCATPRDDAANDARDGGRNALNYWRCRAGVGTRDRWCVEARRARATATDGENAALEQRARARIGRTSFR